MSERAPQLEWGPATEMMDTAVYIGACLLFLAVDESAIARKA